MRKLATRSRAIVPWAKLLRHAEYDLSHHPLVGELERLCALFEGENFPHQRLQPPLPRLPGHLLQIPLPKRRSICARNVTPLGTLGRIHHAPASNINLVYQGRRTIQFDSTMAEPGEAVVSINVGVGRWTASCGSHWPGVPRVEKTTSSEDLGTTRLGEVVL